MKIKLLILVTLLAPSLAQAERYQICTGQFAFCGASHAVPTGRTIIVNTPTGKAGFSEAKAQCPVIDGPAIADVLGGNMEGSCEPSAPGHVWSLFYPFSEVQQWPTWETLPVVPRTFVSGPTANSSNMFSMDCVLGEVVEGLLLSDCFGPINENLRGGVVTFGTEMLTAAPDNATFPVSGPLP